MTVAFSITLFGGPPLVTGDALPADLGVLEIYGGQRYQKSPDGTVNRESSLELAYGLARDWEVSLETPYLSEGKIHDWEDLNVATKYRLVHETVSSPAIAISLKAELPTADASRGLGYDKTIFSTRARAQKSFGAWTTLTNLGYTFLGEPVIDHVKKSRVDPWFASLAEEWKVAKKTSIAAEVYLQTRDKPTAPNRLAYSFAIKQKLTPDLRLHAACGSSLREHDRGGPKLRALVGFKYEWHVRH
ncbi:MAG: transporter [Nibricoccus sp.]